MQITNIKKHFSQLGKVWLSAIGILSAVCALFLTIPVPVVEPAREALAMIQFLSLIVLSLSILAFSIVALLFVGTVDNYLEAKFKFDLGAVGIFTVILFFSFLLFNLWKYIITLYREEWMAFVPMLFSFCAGVLDLSIGVFVLKRLYVWLRFKKIRLFVLTICLAVLALLPVGFEILGSLSINKSHLIFIWIYFFDINMLLLLHFLYKMGPDKKR